MLRKVRKIGAVLLALTMIFVFALGAGAAYYKTPTSTDVDGTIIGSITDSSLTTSLEIKPDAPQSVNFILDGDARDSEFWNNSDAYIEVDVTMNTDGDQVYACMPGFAQGWAWINPTYWEGLLVNGKTITLREPFSTYYSGGFATKGPMAIRVQIYTQSTETQNVEVTVSALRFVGVGNDAEVTTATEPEETTTAPVEDEPDEPVVDDEPEDTDVPDDVEDEPNEVTTADTTISEPEEATTADTTISEPEEEDPNRPITTTTLPNQTTKPDSSSAATTAGSGSGEGGGFAGPIVIIVIVVVVIAAAAVGFIIYRKKKFY